MTAAPVTVLDMESRLRRKKPAGSGLPSLTAEWARGLLLQARSFRPWIAWQGRGSRRIGAAPPWAPRLSLKGIVLLTLQAISMTLTSRPGSKASFEEEI